MKSQPDLGALGQSLGVGLGVFGLILTLLLPMGQASPSARHLALAATWAAAGLMGLAAIRRDEMPAPFASRRSVFGLLLLAIIALRGPLTTEGLEILGVWGGLLVVATSLARSLDGPAKRVLLASFLTATLLVCLEAVLESFFLLAARRGDLDLSHLPAAERAFFLSTRGRSVFGQANGLGGFVLLLLPLSLALARQRRGLGVPLLIALTAALAATRSYGTLAILVVLGLLFAARRVQRDPSRRLVWVATAGLLAEITLGLAIAFGLGFAESLHLPDGHPLKTLELRAAYARVASTLTFEHLPLGLGWNLYGEEARLLAPDAPFAQRPHNAVLNLSAELGVIALGVVAWFGFALNRGLRSAWALPQPATQKRPAFVIALASLLGLAAAVSQGALALAPPAWLAPQSLGHLALITGLALPLALFLSRALARTAGPLRGVGWGALALGLHALIDIDLWIPNLLGATALLVVTLKGEARVPKLRLRIPVILLTLLLASFGLGFALLARPAALAEEFRDQRRVDAILGTERSHAFVVADTDAQRRAAEARPVSREALVSAVADLVTDRRRKSAPEAEAIARRRATDPAFDARSFASEIENLHRAHRLILAAPKSLRESRSFRRLRRWLEKPDEDGRPLDASSFSEGRSLQRLREVFEISDSESQR